MTISENNKIRLHLICMVFLAPFIVAFVRYLFDDGTGSLTINDTDYPFWVGSFIMMYIFECVLFVTGFICWVLVFPERDVDI